MQSVYGKFSSERVRVRMSSTKIHKFLSTHPEARKCEKNIARENDQNSERSGRMTVMEIVWLLSTQLRIGMAMYIDISPCSKNILTALLSMCHTIESWHSVTLCHTSCVMNIIIIHA